MKGPHLAAGLSIGMTLALASCDRPPAAPEAIPSRIEEKLDRLRSSLDLRFPDLVGRALYGELEAVPDSDLPLLLDALLSAESDTEGSLLKHVLNRFAARSPEEAAGWMRAHTATLTRWSGAAYSALPILTSINPDVALSLAGDLSDPMMDRAVWRTAAEQDPAATLNRWQALNGTPDPANEDRLREILYAGVTTDPAAVANGLAALVDGRERLETWRSSIVSSWTQRDPSGLLNWILEEAPRRPIHRDAWLKEFVESLPTAQPERMRELAPLLPPGPHRARLFERAALFTAKLDAPAGTQWVAQLADPVDRNAAERGLAEGTPIELSSGFVIPSDDDSLVRYVEARAVLGLPETFQWAAKLDAMGLRIRALYAAARQWARENPDAVAQAIHDLPAEADQEAAQAGVDAAKK